jgi:hypothetical protein
MSATRRHGGGSWAAVGGAALLAGLIGFGLLVEARTGPLVAAAAALGAYFAIVAALDRLLPARPRPPVAAPDAAAPADADEPLVTLLADAEVCAARLDAASKALRGATGLQVADIAVRARALVRRVMEDPGRLDPVLRAFTYYLPAAADLAEDRARLSEAAGTARLNEIDATLARLAEAFAGFERAALEPDLRDVDIDLRLLDQALKSDARA